MLGFRFKDNVALLTLSVFAFLYFRVPSPEPIKATPYTESQIREGIEREHREKAIRRASATARLVYSRSGCSNHYAEITAKTAYEYALPVRLLAAVAVIESCGNPKAVSGKSSIGLLQINPRVWHYSKTELMNPERNMQIGAKILKMYINRYGLEEGLHAYNGFGNKSNDYATRVLEVSNGKKD